MPERSHRFPDLSGNCPMTSAVSSAGVWELPMCVPSTMVLSFVSARTLPFARNKQTADPSRMSRRVSVFISSVTPVHEALAPSFRIATYPSRDKIGKHVADWADDIEADWSREVNDLPRSRNRSCHWASPGTGLVRPTETALPVRVICRLHQPRRIKTTRARRRV